ncbi:hypothetical protein OBBRIDRAFT_425597 [Obba rivulosa]|uniref:Uncharacterized protein n=1 Tax=Obba rivulosa TaxID=1052685 RepID=A0A8E2DFW1_9APHY|nr:hypothetical protein OBBRIDRAFT_425597 [Obba rivulosa]
MQSFTTVSLAFFQRTYGWMPAVTVGRRRKNKASSRPHRALDDPHLLSMIFEVLEVPVTRRHEESDDDDADDYRTEEDRTELDRLKALARAARVSKLFSEHALNVLWKHLRTLSPLFALLRSLRYVDEDSEREDYESGRESEEDTSRRKFLVRPVKAKEWERFQFYARRIHSATYSQLEEGLDPSVLEMLARKNGNKPLLPALRRLEWKAEAGPSGDIHSIFTLLPSVLQHLEFSFDPGDDVLGYFSELNAASTSRKKVPPFVDDFLRRLETAAPVVQKLLITSTADTLYPSFLPITGPQHLRTVSLSFMDDAPVLKTPTLQALSRLPRLSSLTLQLGDTKLRSDEFVFPVLQDLRLDVSTPMSAVTVINIIAAPSLTSLALPSIWGKELQSHEGLFEAIAARFGSSLRSINICLGVHSSKESKRLCGLLNPLLGLRQLTAVRLDFAWITLELPDTDVRALAKSWPNVRRLFISCNNAPFDPAPSLSALQYFARFCPTLQSLRIPQLDLSRDASSRMPALYHNLKSLAVRQTYGDGDIQRLARCLYFMFPHLDIASDLAAAPRYISDWSSLIVEYNTVRMEQNKDRDT